MLILSTPRSRRGDPRAHEEIAKHPELDDAFRAPNDPQLPDSPSALPAPPQTVPVPYAEVAPTADSRHTALRRGRTNAPTAAHRRPAPVAPPPASPPPRTPTANDHMGRRGAFLRFPQARRGPTRRYLAVWSSDRGHLGQDVSARAS